MISTLPVRRALLGCTAVAAAGALIVVNPLDWLGDEDTADGAPVRAQAEIVVAALSATIESEGELGLGQQRQMTAQGPGTVTALTPAGSEVEPSTVLFAIDGSPSVALVGETPAWRTMGVGDVGVDVEQLEANLVALGHDPEELMSVDETFTAYTAVVVERWQDDHGLETSGSVELGSVVFVPGTATVTSVAAAVGDTLAPGSTSLAALSTGSHQLVFPVEAGDLASIAVGTEVTARLPDRSTVIAAVDGVAANGDGTWQATAIVGDEVDPDSLPTGAAVPVTVSWTDQVAPATTTVRANALTRLDSGAYAIEVVDGDGTRFVEVEVGKRVGSTIQISTDLEPGTIVVAP